MKSVDEVSDDFTEHFAANAGGYLDPSLVHETSKDRDNWPPNLRALSFADPEVVATFAEEAPPTLKWLQGMGVRFEKLEVPFLTSVQPRMAPHGGGFALVEALATEFEKNGGVIHYNTAAQSLIQNEDGTVTGVRAIGPRNKPLEFCGKAVILGCGGFEGNAEMMTRYIGPRALYLRAMSKGCPYNKGEAGMPRRWTRVLIARDRRSTSTRKVSSSISMASVSSMKARGRPTKPTRGLRAKSMPNPVASPTPYSTPRWRK
jgi:tricarballylate dehydrogenase